LFEVIDKALGDDPRHHLSGVIGGIGNQIRRARVFDARRYAIGDTKPLLHLAQNHNPAVRRQL
jgi:hypothetical protein